MNNKDPLNLGLYGYHGRKVANRAVTEADLIIAIGTRFGDRSTGPLAGFARDAKIIHIDVDPAEIGKNVPAYLPIVGDIADVLPRLSETLAGTGKYPQKNAWISGLVEESKTNRSAPASTKDPAISTRTILTAAEKVFPDPILVTDVGRHQMYAAQHFPVSGGRNFISSGGLGTMGFGLPAAIGAAIGRPDKNVVLISGDGSFLMNCQELATASQAGISLTVLIIDDGRLGMIKQLQDDFYGARFDISRFGRDVRFDMLAESLGCKGVRVSTAEELDSALSGAAASGGVTVIDCMVGEESNVYPMVTGATLLDQIEGEA